jgi:hypothetical protein
LKRTGTAPAGARLTGDMTPSLEARELEILPREMRTIDLSAIATTTATWPTTANAGARDRRLNPAARQARTPK